MSASLVEQNGRPAGPTNSAVELLERFEDLARDKRRRGKPVLPSRHELAESFARTDNSIRLWCKPDKYNLPWPFFHLDEGVCLIDALRPRCEVLYANAALCELTGWQPADRLGGRPVSELRYQDSACLRPARSEPLYVQLRELRALAVELVGGRESGTIGTWLVHRPTREPIRVELEMRYGPASEAYYVRVLQVVPQLELRSNVEADVWVDTDGRRQPGLPPGILKAMDSLQGF
jgi:PAS domain-containing protein